MLAVAVGNENERACRAADAALHRRAVALVVRMPDDDCAGGGRRGPVSSLDPSSITMISRHAATARSSDTKEPTMPPR